MLLHRPIERNEWQSPARSASYSELQAVSDPRLGEQMDRLGGVRLDFFSKLVDEDAKVVDLIAVVGPPDRLQQLAVRHDFVRVGDEIAKQIEFFRRQTDLACAGGHTPAVEVDFDAAEFEA